MEDDLENKYKIIEMWPNLVRLVVWDHVNAGSNPVISTYGSLAQLGEHLPYKQGSRVQISLVPFILTSSSMVKHSAVNRVVVGSSPTWPANTGNKLYCSLHIICARGVIGRRSGFKLRYF